MFRYRSRILTSCRLGAAILTLGLTAASTAEAATIYAFEAIDGTNHRAPDATTPNTTASDIWFSDGGICAIDLGNPGWTCGSAVAYTTEFTVTPNAGYSSSITGFSFDEWNTDISGPSRFEVYTSIDGFVTSILGGNLAPAASFSNHVLVLSLFGVTDPFTVRIVASEAPPGQGGFWFLDNVTLDTAAVPLAAEVPEPATLLLLGTGLALAGGRCRRSTV